MTFTRIMAFGLASLLGLAAAQATEAPADIKKAGKLNLTVNSTYAPMEYRDPATNELKGLDIDIAKEIARRFGVGITWSEVPFAELIPALQTKRADFIISGISDRIGRRENADFIDYLKTGAQFFTLADSKVKTEADLCGAKVGTTRSTSFPADIAAWSKEHCENAGKPAIVYVPGENSIDVRNQLKQGRIDAAVQGSETLPYAQQLEAGKYRVVGKPFTLGYQGIMVRKDDTALRAAVMETLTAMVADGSYGKILAAWGLAGNGVEKPLLNAGTQK